MVTDPKNKIGMLVSLPGVLERAAACCGRSRDSRHLEFPLRELLKHLEQVRAKPELIGQFFALYVND